MIERKNKKLTFSSFSKKTKNLTTQDAVHGRSRLRPGRGLLREQHRLWHVAALQVRGRDWMRRRLRRKRKEVFSLFHFPRGRERRASSSLSLRTLSYES